MLSVCDLAKMFLTSKFSFFFTPTPCIKLKTGASHRWEITNSKSLGPIKLSSQSIVGVMLCCAYWHQHPVQEGLAKPACFDKVLGDSSLGDII
jgi:hypothetical protein